MKRGRKPHRPLNWDSLDIDKKIAYLSNISRPNASEQKELRELEQKKKFDGFSKWLKKRREEEKHTESYKNKQIKKCRANREVDSCQECCRYAECYEGKEPYPSHITNAEMRLGHAIILSIENDIMRCYKHGWKDQMTFWLKVLASERTNILTAETVDGYASAQAIVATCHKKYGEFDPIYKKCQETYKPQLERLEKELEIAKSEKKAEKISLEIADVVKKLYGDTM